MKICLLSDLTRVNDVGVIMWIVKRLDDSVIVMIFDDAKCQTGLRSASKVASVTCMFTYRRQVATERSQHEL